MSEGIAPHIASLFPVPLLRLERIHGGRNSRVFKALGHDGQVWLVKEYFHNSPGGSSRLEAEWRACQFLHAHEVRCVPRPVCCDAQKHVAVYQFIEGITPRWEDMHSRQSAALLTAFGDFWEKLYALRHEALRMGMPPAADAAFCLKDLEQHVNNRSARLLAVPQASAVHGHMQAFVREQLLKIVQEGVDRAGQMLRQAGMGHKTLLPQSLRIPSPSDFGSHNVLLTQKGDVCFVDFEYFGMDDPVKLLADTCLHPAMNLTQERQAYLAERMTAMARQAGDDHFSLRFSALAPLWCCVWCCIVLNPFVPQDDARRAFAEETERHETLLRERLTKARLLAKKGEHELLFPC